MEVRINGLFRLLINGVYWGHNPLILTIDPNFLGHLSVYTPKTFMAGRNIHHLKMYFLLKMGMFQPAMFVFGEHVERFMDLGEARQFRTCFVLVGDILSTSSNIKFRNSSWFNREIPSQCYNKKLFCFSEFSVLALIFLEVVENLMKQT